MTIMEVSTNMNQNQNPDLRTQRFPTKAEAERCRKQLVISGYDSHIYKGHRAYVLQWWEPPLPTAEDVKGILATDRRE